MFAPEFIVHRGQRILRIDLSGLASEEIVAAAEQVQRVVTAEPPRSVRALTILFAQLTAGAAQALKRCALADAPHIRASAMVGTSFWKVMAADFQIHGREELRVFDTEAEALDWLAGQ